MKKNGKENGITLVALIITIIVLLILAVVAIGIVRGDGILFHAKDAATKYGTEQKKEQGMLTYYDAFIEGTIGKWIQEGTTIRKANEDGTVVEMKIGDKVNYNELSNGEKSYFIDHTRNGGKSAEKDQELKTENLEWRVLGINEKGQLELISNKPTESTLSLMYETGYLNAEELLNETCDALYGKGEYAESARGLKAKDLDKLANYDPETMFEGYKKEWQYRFSDESENLQYSTDNGVTWEDIEVVTTLFKVPGRDAISTSKPGIEKVTHTCYWYKLTERIEDTHLVDLLTKGEGNSEYIMQWLATREVQCREKGTRVDFGLLVLANGGVDEWNIWNSPGYGYEPSCSMRPVVTLKSEVKVGEKIDGIWQLSM